MSFNLHSFQSIMNKHNKLLLHLFHLVEKLPAEVACFYFTIAKAIEARIRYTDHATRKPFKFIATAPMQSIFVEGPFDRFDWRIRMLLYHLFKHVIHYGIVTLSESVEFVVVLVTFRLLHISGISSAVNVPPLSLKIPFIIPKFLFQFCIIFV